MYRCRYVDTKTKVHKLNIAAYPYKHFVWSAYSIYKMKLENCYWNYWNSNPFSIYTNTKYMWILGKPNCSPRCSHTHAPHTLYQHFRDASSLWWFSFPANSRRCSCTHTHNATSLLCCFMPISCCWCTKAYRTNICILWKFRTK